MKSNVLIIAVFLLSFASCTEKKNGEDMPINKYQVIGSHNSYKQAIEASLLDSLKQLKYDMSGLEYAHIPIPEQLDLGLRNLEIDVYPDSKGGRYAHPKGLDLVPNQMPYNADGVMNSSGFKVFHVLDVDFRSSCPTLDICLKQLKDWSDKNPGHFPVFITLEVKGSSDEIPNTHGMSTSERITTSVFNRLDSALVSGLGEDKLITPDFVRGNHNTLNEAVTKYGWPTLDVAKGRFLFILDDRKEKRELYRNNHPSLKERVMFINAKAGDSEAATMIMNNPEDNAIPEMVKQGYIIRTRADANTVEARKNDYAHFNAACNSGAQIITTDYYKPSKFFNSPYHIAFADSSYVRANPLFKVANN